MEKEGWPRYLCWLVVLSAVYSAKAKQDLGDEYAIDEDDDSDWWSRRDHNGTNSIVNNSY